MACLTAAVRTLLYLRKGTLEWVDAPDIGVMVDTDAIVRPIAVARCDLDGAFLRHDLGRPLQLAHAAKMVDRRLSMIRAASPLPARSPSVTSVWPRFSRLATRSARCVVVTSSFRSRSPAPAPLDSTVHQQSSKRLRNPSMPGFQGGAVPINAYCHYWRHIGR
jgi:hypothetical protein